MTYCASIVILTHLYLFSFFFFFFNDTATTEIYTLSLHDALPIVTAIVAHDLQFYDELPRLFPHVDARSWFVGNEPLVDATAFRNGSLQGAYLILAARALGLDAGPMSGFDNEKVDREFFPDRQLRSNFLVNLGYGDRSRLHARNPRLSFEEAARVL